jgi:hypothetical protein
VDRSACDPLAANAPRQSRPWDTDTTAHLTISHRVCGLSGITFIIVIRPWDQDTVRRPSTVRRGPAPRAIGLVTLAHRRGSSQASVPTNINAGHRTPSQ